MRCMAGILQKLLVSVTVTLSTSCVVDVLQGRRVLNSTFALVENSRLYACVAECVSFVICKSFQFEKHNRTCYLNFENSRDSTLADDTDFVYSDRDVWRNVSLGPCQSTRCGTHMRCTVRRNGQTSCVDAFGPSIAQSKPTTASSSFSSRPENAVDGRDPAIFGSGSCFHVSYADIDPWWQVDLQRIFVVVEVQILTRSDCCPERLHDFAIEMFKDDPVSQTDAQLQLCYLYSGAVRQRGVFTSCTCTTPVSGRYLRIHGKNKLNHRDILQFCEVMVYGFLSKN